MRRCLDCLTLTEGSRCDQCRNERKRIRNAHARAFGPCPQDTVCHLCGKPPRPGDPLTWDHVVPISRGGGAEALPAHLSCNSRRQAKDLD